MSAARTVLTFFVVGAALIATYYLPRVFNGASGTVAPIDAPDHGCEGARTLPYEDLASAETATLCLINAERRSQALVPLRVDPRLRAAAVDHSEDMVEQGFYAHTSPDGSGTAERIARAGYVPSPGGITGENLAIGEEQHAMPAAIVASWMASPGHRENILRPEFREIGIGISAEPAERSPPDADGATYTTDFGSG